MREHHRRTVERLVQQFAEDPRFPALIVGGSVARGWDKEDSDLDIILVATAEEYARRSPSGDFHYLATDVCDYPGGYVDGKVVDMAFLHDVAERGSEPARAAFVGAMLAYSRIPGLQETLSAIPVYPQREQKSRLESFHAQVLAMRWYMGEADKRDNRYLRMHVASDLVLYGGRMILAHNRILYPYHKWLLKALSEAPLKPQGLMERIDELLANPCRETANRFCDCILGFTDWPAPPEGWAARFMHDVEWPWRRGATPLADW
ncbi:MAG: hypothetical protein ACOY94_05235 [Bacillota bacterium]